MTDVRPGPDAVEAVQVPQQVRPLRGADPADPPAPPRLDQLQVVIAHDYLTQRGGAERVVLALMEAFPKARLVTSVYDPEATFEEFKRYRVETMWPQRIGFFRRDPRRALPFLAHAFSTHEVGETDLIISSTSGWAHGLGSDRPMVVYCHNPARWLYQAEDYFSGRLGLLRKPFRYLSRPLRRWDKRSASATSVYFANSRAVKERIAGAYGIDAALLPPPTGITPDGESEPVPGVEPGFLLTISRPRAYKNVAVACEAVAGLDGVRMVVVGTLPPRRDGAAWPDRISCHSDLTDAQMRWLYASCAGIVAVSREDFGLTPVEGFSFGKPAALLRAGGYLDSAAPGVASVWIEQATPAAARAGIVQLLERSWDADAIRRHAEQFSRESFQARLQEAARSVAAMPWRRPRSVEGSGPARGRRAADRQDSQQVEAS